MYRMPFAGRPLGLLVLAAIACGPAAVRGQYGASAPGGMAGGVPSATGMGEGGPTVWFQPSPPSTPVYGLPAPKEPARFVATPEDRERLTATLAAMETVVTIDATSVPLGEFVAGLEKQAGLTIELDLRALEMLGIVGETEITRHIPAMPLRQALDLVLNDLELKWTPRPGYVLITSPEEADADLMIRIYPVADLVLRRAADGTIERDFSELVLNLSSLINSEGWDIGGGTCSIRDQEGTLLAIGAPWSVHRTIETYLSTLREARQETAAILDALKEMPQTGGGARSSPAAVSSPGPAPAK